MKAKKKNDCDFTVKAVIIGDSGVGKTNILLRFCDDTFRPTYSSTIGVDFKLKVMQVHEYKIKMQIWDTAGQEKFKNIAPTFYKGSIAIILTYSIDQAHTYENIENWIRQIHENSSADILIFLVGNKLDMRDQRKVETSVGQKLADKYGMAFMEVSAKDGTNIQLLFDQIGEAIYERIKKADSNLPSSGNKENDVVKLEKDVKG